MTEPDLFQRMAIVGEHFYSRAETSDFKTWMSVMVKRFGREHVLVFHDEWHFHASKIPPESPAESSEPLDPDSPTYARDLRSRYYAMLKMGQMFQDAEPQIPADDWFIMMKLVFRSSSDEQIELVWNEINSGLESLKLQPEMEHNLQPEPQRKLPVNLTSWLMQLIAIGVIAAPFLLIPKGENTQSILSDSPGWVKLVSAIGLFVASATFLGFALIMLLVIWRFGIPMAVRLYVYKSTDSLRPVFKYLMWCAAWACIIAGLLKTADHFIPEISRMAYYGLILPLLLGLGRTGANKSNWEEFVAYNRKYIKPESLPELRKVYERLPD